MRLNFRWRKDGVFASAAVHSENSILFCIYADSAAQCSTIHILRIFKN